MQKSFEGNWNATKRVLRYFKGTQELGSKYSNMGDFKLIRYSYLDYDGDKENGLHYRRRVCGYCKGNKGYCVA